MSFPTTPGSLRRARTPIAALLAIAGIALVGALTASSVSAESGPGTRPHPGEDETIKVAGGYLKFHHYGEIVEVNDTVLDGRGLRGFVLANGSKTVTDRVADDVPVRRNFSIHEGSGVLLTLCYTHDGKTGECSQSQRAYA